MENLEAVAHAAALEGAGALSEHWQAVERVELKSPVELVTEADRKSEAAILKCLKEAFPDHAVVAEESAPEARPCGWTWYVDPLDGTTNFAHGYPRFAISLAVARQGETVFGLVYDPLSRDCFSARRGGGARLNREKIRVSGTKRLADALLATGFPYDRRSYIDYYLAFLRQFLLSAQGVRRAGAAALDLCDVACGRLDGFWEWKLHVWDTAAGILIVREAGGRASDFDGDEAQAGSLQTLASNGLIHGQMLEALQRVLAKVGRRPAKLRGD
jgi:Archaeal fructose-1,6-bisphosphatase and related enzymes of inositol monophosphatase family